MQSKTQLYLALIFVQILFGINFVVSKIIVGQMSPGLWAFLRFLCSGLFLLFYLFLSKKKFPQFHLKDWFNLIFFAFLGFTLGQTLFLKGIQLSTAGHAAILSSTIPLFAFLFSLLKKEETLTPQKTLGLLLSFIGILVIQKIENFSFSENSALGDGLILLSCVGIGAYFTFAKNFLKRHNTFWITALIFFTAAIEILPIATFEIPTLFLINYSWPLIFSIAYSILGATILAYFLSNWVLTQLSAGTVAIFTYLQPITALIISSLFLNDQITLRTLIGTSFIFLGLYLTLNMKKLK